LLIPWEGSSPPHTLPSALPASRRRSHGYRYADSAAFRSLPARCEIHAVSLVRRSAQQTRSVLPRSSAPNLRFDRAVLRHAVQTDPEQTGLPSGLLVASTRARDLP